MSAEPSAEKGAPVQYGVRLLVPHPNAGETVWMPDRWYAEHSITPGLGELVTRPIPPATPLSGLRDVAPEDEADEWGLRR